MTSFFPAQLFPSALNHAASASPNYSKFAGLRIYRFSVNFLSFPRFLKVVRALRVAALGQPHKVTKGNRNSALHVNLCHLRTSGLCSESSPFVSSEVETPALVAHPSTSLGANGERGLPHLNGGSLNARSFRECSFAPSRRSSLQASIPIRICSLIARS
jgi:hypothetical protein